MNALLYATIDAQFKELVPVDSYKPYDAKNL